MATTRFGEYRIRLTGPLALLKLILPRQGSITLMAQPPPLDAWEPLSVAEANTIFSPLGVPWWIAGGWAVDLFVGHQTREHADIDIAMRRADTTSLRQLTKDFDLYIAHDGSLTPWDGAPLGSDQHQFWACRRDPRTWAFEVLLEEHDGERWLYRRNPAIALPFADFGRVSSDGVPYVAPQVALLYKAYASKPVAKNEVDFALAAPFLDPAALGWLVGVLRATNDRHPWLDRLEGPTAR